MSGATVGYNGQVHEVETSWQFLGSGLRIYNPALARFHSADGMSPFGRGGVNAYAYCAGDPVNRADPTGHYLMPIAAIMGLGALATGGLAVERGLKGDVESAAILGAIAGGLGLAMGFIGGGRAFHAVRSSGSGRLSRSASMEQSALPRQPNGTAAPAAVGWGWDGDVIVRIRDVQGVRSMFVSAHGRPFGVSWGPDFVDGMQLVRRLKSAGTGKAQVRHIHLNACCAGAGRKGAIAQEVANGYGVPTSAYPDSTFGGWAGSPEVMSFSPVRAFLPQTGLARVVSAIRNRKLNRIARRPPAQRS